MEQDDVTDRDSSSRPLWTFVAVAVSGHSSIWNRTSVLPMPSTRASACSSLCLPGEVDYDDFCRVTGHLPQHSGSVASGQTGIRSGTRRGAWSNKLVLVHKTAFPSMTMAARIQSATFQQYQQ